MQYRAPVSGMYFISSTVTKIIFTGHYEYQENYHKKRYQFWKPDYVWEPKYKSVITHESKEYKSLEQGEVVHSAFPPERVQV